MYSGLKPTGWAKDFTRHFSKEDTQMANKHVERCLVSLVIREMQIKTALRYGFIPGKMAAIKKRKNEQMLARIWRHWNLCR